jgi:zinc protease
MLGQGGTKQMSYKQVVDAMYPMATSVKVVTDKEMTSFAAETHSDNLEKFYGIMREMLLDPGWRAEDFERLRDQSINFLRVSLRGNNDEELAKEELYNSIYAKRPYGHESVGTVAALKGMSISDLQEFYKRHYTQANLIIGIAGGYTPEFLNRVKRDFGVLPEGPGDVFDLPAPDVAKRSSATLIQKDTRSVAWSLGYPITVKRGDPDFPALLVAQSYMGQHRSHGRLFQRIRQLRGLNYGDYAYIEYFPRGMFLFEPEPNLARHQQIFQIWVRPVEPPNAVFALRLALFELDRLVQNGMNQADFERTRAYLSKYVNVLTKTKSAELGYRIDSLYYGMPDYNQYIKQALAQLTLDDVNHAIRKYLHSDTVSIVGVAKDTDQLRTALASGEPTPMHYNSAKPAEVLEEDKTVEKWPLHLSTEQITVVPVDSVFEN